MTKDDILIKLAASGLGWGDDTHTLQFLQGLINSIVSVESEQFSTDELLRELSVQTILPIVFPKHKFSTAIIAQNMQIFYEHTELHNFLTENNIPYVILKGAHWGLTPERSNKENKT